MFVRSGTATVRGVEQRLPEERLMSIPADFRERLTQMSDDELHTLQRMNDLSPQQQELVLAEQRSRADAQLGSDAAPASVILRDVDVPFWNLMTFMVKWVLASIPALIILLTITILVGGLLVGFLREFR